MRGCGWGGKGRACLLRDNGDKRDAEQHGDAGSTVGCGFTGHVDGAHAR